MFGWNNGEIQPVDEMTIPVLDRGVQYGEGLYETMLVRQDEIPLLNRHCKRLQSACQRLDLPYPGDRTIQQAIKEIVLKNGSSETELSEDDHFILKLLLTGGQGEGLYRSDPPDPYLMILPRSFPDHLQSWKSNGGIARFVPSRGNTGSDLGQVKSTSRLGEALALERVHREDEVYREAFFVGPSNRLLQGARSNIFVQIDRKWYTPPVSDGVLPGVAREVLLEKSDTDQMEEQTLFTEDLLQADLVVVTNAVTGPVQIRKIVAPSLLAFERSPLTFPVENSIRLNDLWTDVIET